MVHPPVLVHSQVKHSLKGLPFTFENENSTCYMFIKSAHSFYTVAYVTQCYPWLIK